MRMEVLTVLAHVHQELGEEATKSVHVASLAKLDAQRVRHMAAPAAQHAAWGAYCEISHNVPKQAASPL